MREAAEKEGIDADIAAVAVDVIPDQLKKMKAQVIMIGPQMRFRIPQLQEKYSIPVAMIDIRSYGTMDGHAVLADAIKLIEDQGGTSDSEN